MKALIRTRRILVLLVAISVVTMTSCTDTAAGIFSRVQAEKSTTDNITDDIQGSSPSYVVKLGSTYFAGIGPTLWSKAINDTPTKWDKAIIPTGFSGTVIAASGAVIEVSGTETLFVVFSDSTGSSVWKKTDVESWTVVSGLPSDRYLRTLLATPTKLFAVTANKRSSVETPENYSIHYLNSGAFVGTSIIVNSSIGFPNSVASPDGTTFWFTAGDSLLTGSESVINVLSTEPEGGSAYAGVCSVGTDILVSNRLGYLYYTSDNGVHWISNASAYTSSTGKVYSLSTPTYFEVGSARTLLVGTKIPTSSTSTVANGYLNIDLTTKPFAPDTTPVSGDTALSTAINFASSLTTKSVNTMPFFDISTSKKQLFALTDGDGLWSNTYADDADTATTDLVWGGWVRE